MDVLEAIRSRRSIGIVSDQLPPRSVIERILEAATHAPNHHKVEPWRFTVLTGDARGRLGDVDAELAASMLGSHVGEEQRRAVMDAQRSKSFRAPVVIVATVARSETNKEIDVENVAAVAAAIQNLLLAAHAEGLGAKWRTGSVAYEPAAKKLFGLNDDEHILGFIYVGYPAEDPADSPRRPLGERVRWWGEWQD